MTTTRNTQTSPTVGEILDRQPGARLVPDAFAVLDYLREHEFEITGETTTDGGDVYDDVWSGFGTVRVVGFCDDGPRFDLFVFDGHMCLLWSAEFSNDTPAAAIIATVDTARRQIAHAAGRTGAL